MSQKIGMVGVGRMGANMARRLKDCGHEVSVVQDIHAPAAEELATELGCQVASSLSEVTANADIIFTVVTDDGAMREIFTAENLLKDASGKTFINWRHSQPRAAAGSRRRLPSRRRQFAGSLHGFEHSPGPQW